MPYWMKIIRLPDTVVIFAVSGEDGDHTDPSMLSTSLKSSYGIGLLHDLMHKSISLRTKTEYINAETQ